MFNINDEIITKTIINKIRALLNKMPQSAEPKQARTMYEEAVTVG